MEVIKFKFKERMFDGNWTLREANLIDKLKDYSTLVDILNKKKLSGEEITLDNFTEHDFFKFIEARMTAVATFLAPK